MSRPTEAEFVEFARWALPETDSTTRAAAAAWTVGRTLGCDLAHCEWGTRSLVTPYGTRVDVKAAAYLRAWDGVGARGVRYDRMRPARGTTPGDVYVLGLHTATTPEAYDLWDFQQWQWRVVPRCSVDELDQSSVGLAKLQDMDTCQLVSLAALADAIEHAGKHHREHSNPGRAA